MLSDGAVESIFWKGETGVQRNCLLLLQASLTILSANVVGESSAQRFRVHFCVPVLFAPSPFAPYFLLFAPSPFPPYFLLLLTEETRTLFFF
jgi:hypothetical protein